MPPKNAQLLPQLPPPQLPPPSYVAKHKLTLEIEKLKSEIFLMNLKCALNEALQKQPDIYEYIEACHVNENSDYDITKYSSSVNNDVLNYALSFENPKVELVQQILTKLKGENKEVNNQEICELIAASYLKTSEKIALIEKNNLKDNLNSPNVDGTTPIMILLNNIDFDKDYEEISQFEAFFKDLNLDLTQENNNGNDGFSILNNLLVKLMNSYADELSKNYMKIDNDEKITETNRKLKESIEKLTAKKNLN